MMMPTGQDDPAGTDYQLAGLVVAIRRHILDTPTDTWDSSVVEAAQAVTAAVGLRLADQEGGTPGRPW